MTTYAPKIYTASTTLGPSDADTCIVINAAAGATISLPTAVGSGYTFKVFIGTTVTSGSVVIKRGLSSDIMQGVILNASATNVETGWSAGSNGNTITLNGSTSGGIKGDYFLFTDAIAGLWTVDGLTSGTGTIVTPFSNT